MTEIEEEVLQILTSRETIIIKFQFQSVLGTSVEVDSSTFLRVATAVKDRRIRVDQRVPRGLAAQYNWLRVNGGNLHVRRARNNIIGKSVFIHESVHASIDLTRSRLSEVDNEVAGFLAQIIYLQNSSYSHSLLTSRNSGIMGRLIEALWTAAESKDQKTGLISETHISEIRDLIGQNPIYSYIFTDGCFVEGFGSSECNYVITSHNG